MSTLVTNDVRYFVRDADCLGRSCLDLGREIKPVRDDKGFDIRCKMHSGCRRMLGKGCPLALPRYDRQIAEKHMLSGVRVDWR
jgi:hypothetical protein